MWDGAVPVNLLSYVGLDGLDVKVVKEGKKELKRSGGEEKWAEPCRWRLSERKRFVRELRRSRRRPAGFPCMSPN